MTNNFRRLHGIPMRTKKGYKVKIEKEKMEFLLFEKNLGIKHEQLIFPWRGGRRFRKSHKKGTILTIPERMYLVSDMMVIKEVCG